MHLVLKISLICLGALAIAAIVISFFSAKRIAAYEKLPDTQDLAQRIQTRGREYVSSRPHAALVIGVIQRGREHVATFGQIDSGSTNKPTAHTLFEIGSVTKVFTAVALAKLAKDGVLQLDDPVVKFLPPDGIPQRDDLKKITLRHLATHTSGLERLPPNLENSSDPYANYDDQALYESLKIAVLSHEPGKKHVYSNFGFGLLGHALERAAKQPYERLIKEQILNPLGMDETIITLAPAQAQQLAPGHEPSGKKTANWHFKTLAPAGAFLSTADDLLLFLRANLNPPTDNLGAAIRETHQPHLSHWALKSGLGWQMKKTLEGPTILWHNGGTGGYISFVAFDPQHGNGVVLLSNSGDAFAGDNSIDRLGLDIMLMASKISIE